MFTFRPPSKNIKTLKTGNANGSAGHEAARGANGDNHANSEARAAERGLSDVAGNAFNWLTNGHKGTYGRGNRHGRMVESVLGPGIDYKGTLTGVGGVRIEGTFDGAINVEGAVVITDGAKVTADIRASAVAVGGSLKGNIVAGKVEIMSTGRIWGDLTTSALSTEEGAFLRGQVRMEDQIEPAGVLADVAPEPAEEPSQVQSRS